MSVLQVTNANMVRTWNVYPICALVRTQMFTIGMVLFAVIKHNLFLNKVYLFLKTTSTKIQPLFTVKFGLVEILWI